MDEQNSGSNAMSTRIGEDIREVERVQHVRMNEPKVKVDAVEHVSMNEPIVAVGHADEGEHDKRIVEELENVDRNEFY